MLIYYEEVLKESHSEASNLSFIAHHFDKSRDTSRLIVQLQETEMNFDQFYEDHTKELKRCLELRRFENDFRDLQVHRDDLTVKLPLQVSICRF